MNSTSGMLFLSKLTYVSVQHVTLSRGNDIESVRTKIRLLNFPTIFMKGFKEIEKAFYTARNYEFLKMLGDC